MTEAEMVRDLARRTGISPTDAQSVLTVLGEIAHEQRRQGKRLPVADLLVPAAEPRHRPSYVPTEKEIGDLIAAAGSHPLGLDFLLNGELSAVATMFRAHAFTVDAARERIRAGSADLAQT